MSKSKKRDVLKADYFPIARIDVHAIRQMYDVFSQYYEKTSWAVFLGDLSKKTGAIIVRNSAGRVVGFTTVMICKVMVGERRLHGLFSGDTIVEQAYWGARALQIEFFKLVIKQKARHPFGPVYWFLICKGYKTYLLLANNVSTFYPRHEGNAGYLADIVDAYCEQMFPAYYDRERRILDFGNDYSPLRSGVAEITDRMREESRSIRYFEDCNPEWRRGTELPCVGEIRWLDFMKFLVRYANKPARKRVPEAEAGSSDKANLATPGRSAGD